MLEVRVAKIDELKNWNTFIGASPYGTIFHLLEWLKIIEKHTNSTLYPLIGLKGERVIGVFPIFYKKIGPLKMVFSPPPKVGVPYLGPTLLDYDKLKQEKKESLIMQFCTEINKFIGNEIKSNYTYLKLPPGLVDCRPFKWMGYQAEPFYSYLLDISVDLPVLESNFSMQARKNIRKAEKEGLILELGDKEELLILYKMLYERYSGQKREFPISKAYLLDVFNKLFPENLKVFVVRQDDEIVGGGVKLCYKEKIIDWIGQPKTKIRVSNDFLHWGVMKWGIENGYHHYEILGANTLSISQFKSKFNPKLSVKFSVKKASLLAAIVERIYANTRKRGSGNFERA